MENSICIGEILKDFNWWAYIGSVVTVFIIGAIWFSFLFMKMWVEANKIDLNQKGSSGNTIFTMLFQLFTTALVGFSIFIVTKISTDFAILYILAIAGWMASNLKFKFVDWKMFYKACLAEVGYFLVSGFVFLMFGLI